MGDKSGDMWIKDKDKSEGFMISPKESSQIQRFP